MSTVKIPMTLAPDAYALQVADCSGNASDDTILYETVTFPQGDRRAGCLSALQHLRDNGYLHDDGAHLIIDVLNVDGDIVDEAHLTRAGLAYLEAVIELRPLVPDQPTTAR